LLKDSDMKALYACKQPDGSERKEIESSGVFLTGLHYYHHCVAQQPNGQWQAFDEKPVLSHDGWQRVGDRPDDLKVEGDLGVSWEKTLCIHDRYKVKLTRERKTFRV
jgi:hypothetical protein